MPSGERHSPRTCPPQHACISRSRTMPGHNHHPVASTLRSAPHGSDRSAQSHDQRSTYGGMANSQELPPSLEIQLTAGYEEIVVPCARDQSKIFWLGCKVEQLPPVS